MRWLHAPLLHFLAGGAALFVLVHRRDPGPAIVLTAGDVGRLRADYARETGLDATPADEAALVDKAVREELLFREALARGLDRNDRSVRSWLVEQMRVLGDGATDDPERLWARAHELGLDRTDVVVRRILVQKMRLLAARSGERTPTDTELAAFWGAHRDEYRPADRVTFWHVLLHDGADVDALRARRPEDAAREGASFAVPPHLVAQSPAQVERLFGPAVADAVGRAERGRWIGPVRSAYGAHLLWIEARTPGTPPSLDQVRGRLVERWQDEQRAVRVAALLRDLARRWPVRVESAAWRDRSAS